MNKRSKKMRRKPIKAKGKMKPLSQQRRDPVSNKPKGRKTYFIGGKQF